MTVTPRYQAYPDVQDTGLTVPLQLPAAGRTVSPQTCVSSDQHQLSQDGSQHNHCNTALQEWACLYHCRQSGVDRVFVDHPLFLDPYNAHGIYNVNTYLQGADFPDIDLRYSILCQAALAAPILLWHQPADHLLRLRLQAVMCRLPQTLSGGVAQYIGLDRVGSDAPLTAAAERHAQQVWSAAAADHLHDDSIQHIASTGPTSLSGGVAQRNPAATNWSVRQAQQQQQHQYPVQQQQQQQSTQPEQTDILWPTTVGKIAYVGNDWPCFPLSQHLQCLQYTDDAVRFHHDPKGSAVSSGVMQASQPLACLAANSFRTHMARLLKSARVAFCIHSLAYQGVFPQV